MFDAHESNESNDWIGYHEIEMLQPREILELIQKCWQITKRIRTGAEKAEQKWTKSTGVRIEKRSTQAECGDA